MQQGFFRASDKVIHDHHAGKKKQNISSGFSVFLSVGHLGKRRWVTSEKRRPLSGPDHLNRKKYVYVRRNSWYPPCNPQKEI